MPILRAAAEFLAITALFGTLYAWTVVGSVEPAGSQAASSRTAAAAGARTPAPTGEVRDLRQVAEAR
ncbi:MAG TPA: hypothetical protein VEY95_02340 [Azospirillaceae bacterium]|nr:hypothetical protein [Azospirillaceae bacterium]